MWPDNHQGRYNLLRACFHSYRSSFLSAIIPRLCLTAFTFSQPFLIDTTVSFVGQTERNKDYGKGLIGAWALVFVGMAVSEAAVLGASQASLLADIRNLGI